MSNPLSCILPLASSRRSLLGEQGQGLDPNGLRWRGALLPGLEKLGSFVLFRLFILTEDPQLVRVMAWPLCC